MDATPFPTHGLFKDLTGRRFGRLRVSHYAGMNAHGQSRWACVCDCGAIKVARSLTLKNGQSTSCGCRQREVTARRNRTHGLSKIPEYRVWKAMHSRCENPNHTSWPDYGGRGIYVCDDWHAFEIFLDDMGARPSPRHSLDRKDVNGNYGPHNCRWATPKEQSRNARSNRRYTLDGQTKCLSEWAEATGVSYSVLKYRLCHGYSLERAIATPVRRRA